MVRLFDCSEEEFFWALYRFDPEASLSNSALHENDASMHEYNQRLSQRRFTLLEQMSDEIDDTLVDEWLALTSERARVATLCWLEVNIGSVLSRDCDLCRKHARPMIIRSCKRIIGSLVRLRLIIIRRQNVRAVFRAYIIYKNCRQ